MHRFYISGEVVGETAVISDAEQLHHLKDVLRLKTGDEVTVFDPRGNEYLCTIAGFEKKQAVLRVNSKKTSPPKNLKIAIACAIPKKSKMDDVVDKLTQLGMDEIIPLETERVIVKLDENNHALEERLERWKKIARSAAEQSQRNTLPVISRIRRFQDILVESDQYNLKLIPTLAGESKPIKKVISVTKPAHILVLIGPEGDFTSQEVEQAIQAGFIPVSLGGTVLRVETAAIAIAGYITFAMMD